MKKSNPDKIDVTEIKMSRTYRFVIIIAGFLILAVQCWLILSGSPNRWLIRLCGFLLGAVMSEIATDALHVRMRNVGVIRVSGVIAFGTVMAIFSGLTAQVPRSGLEVSRFPWPPPPWSAIYSVPESLFAATNRRPTMGDVERFIDRAVIEGMSNSITYYPIHGGFAGVTQLDRISSDGGTLPFPERRRIRGPALVGFSLRGYFEALMSANAGRYRLLVFVVTDEPFSATNEPASFNDVEMWFERGSDRLPKALRESEFSTAHALTILIYEFEKSSATGSVLAVRPSEFPGYIHVQRSGFLNIIPNL